MMKNSNRLWPDLFNNFYAMTKERILLMIEQLLKIYNELDNEELEENNLVEFMGEDENGNWIYKFK